MPPILFAGALDLARRARQEGAIHMWNASLARFDPNDYKIVILFLVIARDITKHMVSNRKAPSNPALAAPRARGRFVPGKAPWCRAEL